MMICGLMKHLRGCRENRMGLLLLLEKRRPAQSLRRTRWLSEQSGLRSERRRLPYRGRFRCLKALRSDRVVPTSCPKILRQHHVQSLQAVAIVYRRPRLALQCSPP